MSFYTYVNQIGNRIFHRWVDASGKRRTEIVDFSPTLYVPTNKSSIYRGIRGEQLESVELGSIEDAREFTKKYADVENFPISGNTNWWAQFLQREYTGEVNWDLSKLVIANIDIETFINDPSNPGRNPLDNPIEAVNAITAITIEVKNKYVVFGSKPYTGELPANARHIYCENEETLLGKFLQAWGAIDPDVITGWNIKNFDIPYLIGRIRDKLGSEAVNRLSPSANKLKVKRVVNIREFSNGSGIEVGLMGVSILDYLEMYKKFTYKLRERYSLDHIAYVELGERKLDYSEYGNLDSLYEKNYNKYIDYNIRDAGLVRRLDDKLNLMMLVMTLAYMCHIRLEDVFSQVRMWDTLIYNQLLEKNVIIPPKGSFSKDEKYEGAYVREPKVGMHDWVVSFDLDSLYPHLIMQYNISPEMLVDSDPNDDRVMFGIEAMINKTADLGFLIDEDLSMSANKQFFKRDTQGFLPYMMDHLYSQRKVVKRKMLDADSDVETIKGILKDRGVSVEGL